MRTCLTCLTVFALSAGSLAAQSQAATGGAEGSVAVHALRREDSAKTWPGGGFGGAWNGGRLALAGEATITRRDGHNDWHALAGPRVMLFSNTRTRAFVQVLAGTVIRQKEARFSAQLGGGIDVSLTPRASVRFQLAGLRDQTVGDTLSSGRLSLGLVVR
jgi:hypothetical protein